MAFSRMRMLNGALEVSASLEFHEDRLKSDSHAENEGEESDKKDETAADGHALVVKRPAQITKVSSGASAPV